MDDLDYFPGGGWPTEDVAYRGYAGPGRPAAGRHRGEGSSDGVWQRMAATAWPLLEGQAAGPRADWPDVPPDTGSWPAADPRSPDPRAPRSLYGGDAWRPDGGAPAPYPRPGHGPAGYPAAAGYPSGAFPAADYPSGAFPAADYPSGGFPAAGYASGGYPATGPLSSGGFPAAGHPSGPFPVAGYPAAGYDGDFGPGGLGATDFSSDFSTADFSTADFSTAEFSTAEFTADDFAAGDLAESGLAAADYAPGAYPPVRRAPREYPPRDRASREGGARDGGPLDSAPRGRGPRGRGPRPERGQAPRRPDTDQEARRRQPQGTSLLSGYVPATGAAYEPRESDTPRRPSASAYKPFPEWLPFGHRLALLPKELADDPDEEPREHRDVSGGWLRPAVFGAMDGLVTNSSLIAGVGGGGGGHGAIILTGIAGLIAGAFSMATGEYISVKSQNELTQAEVELERRQHKRDRAGKLDKLTQVFIGKGVSPNLAEAVARQISADPDRAVATHIREELGLDPDDLPSPVTAAVASLISFTIGALLPLAPFLAGVPSLPAALGLAGLAAYAGGAAVAKLTGRSAVLGGLRQFTAAFLATGMAFAIGHLIGGHVA